MTHNWGRCGITIQALSLKNHQSGFVLFLYFVCLFFGLRSSISSFCQTAFFYFASHCNDLNKELLKVFPPNCSAASTDTVSLYNTYSSTLGMEKQCRLLEFSYRPDIFQHQNWSTKTWLHHQACDAGVSLTILLRFISLEWWSKESRNMTCAVWWHWAPLTAFLALCDTLTLCSRASLRLWYRHRHWASPNSAGCSGTSWAHEADVFMDFEVHLISVWSGLFVKYFRPSSFLTPEYSCRSLLWVHTPTEPVFIAGHACSLILCFWLLIWALWLDCFLNGLQVSCAAFDSFQ